MKNYLYTILGLILGGLFLTVFIAQAVDLRVFTITQGGTGTSTKPSDGQLLIGSGGAYNIGNLTAGSNITITNSSGSITIASTGGSGTFTTTTINGISATAYTFATSTNGNGFTITTSSQTVTFNLPEAGTTTVGLVNIGTQTFGGGVKNFQGDLNIYGATGVTFYNGGGFYLLQDLGSAVYFSNSNDPTSPRFQLDNSTATSSLTFSSAEMGGNANLDFRNVTTDRNYAFPNIAGSLVVGTSTIGSLARWTALNTLQNAVAGVDFQAPITLTQTFGQVHIASSSNNWTFTLPQTIWATSSVQFGGVTSTLASFTTATTTNLNATGTLTIPNGATCDANDVGELCNDTTANKLIGASGTTSGVFANFNKDLFSFVLTSSSPTHSGFASGTIKNNIPTRNSGFMLENVICYTDAGTSTIYFLQDNSDQT